MTKINKLALLAGVVGFVTSAHAAGYTGDLLIGFSDGVGNDVIYDLGAPTVITDGANWNLASVTSTFMLTTVNWGVVGNTLVNGANRLCYTTFNITPLPLGAGAASQINTDDKALYTTFTTAGAGQHITIAPTEDNSWNRQTINPTLDVQYANEWENPNIVGTTSFKFWRVQADTSAPILLGTFNLAANGVLTFHTNSVVTTPPPPQITSITRAGNLSTISFTTTNGSFTYKLSYTNATGLKAATSLWATSPTTVSGNGSVQSIPDTTTDTNRFYRVSVQ
ncbi:MAG TPA: hypothetical protein VH597_16515 [Verrucomicrobiae bacterium]|nr:hypothetical protein [Verrucomicrobiae bacterium]